MSQIPEETLEKVLTFIACMTPRQFEVILEMQTTDFNGPDPERAARGIFDNALFAGIRSSVIYFIVKHFMTSKAIAFDIAELNSQRAMARQGWENVGKYKWLSPPPLTRDPKFSPPTTE